MVADFFSSSQEDLLCTDKGASDGHLGLEIKCAGGKMTLNQPQLIKRRIELLGAKDSNPKAILVVKPLLNKNADGKEINEDRFHHRSTIGSL